MNWRIGAEIGLGWCAGDRFPHWLQRWFGLRDLLGFRHGRQAGIRRQGWQLLSLWGFRFLRKNWRFRCGRFRSDTGSFDRLNWRGQGDTCDRLQSSRLEVFRNFNRGLRWDAIENDC